MNSADLKKEQIKSISEYLSNFEDCLFIGDFNFDSDRISILENDSMKELLPEFKDLWKQHTMIKFIY
jgi:hypothetical protein